MEQFREALDIAMKEYRKNGDIRQFYTEISSQVMMRIRPTWEAVTPTKKACYFSAEFLIGRVIEANLYNLGLLEDVRTMLLQNQIDPHLFEGIDDAALGNGGLGRLAACFLDSAATHKIQLDGFGIRYHYGLFKQYFEDGIQKEIGDDWLRFGDPWSVRKESEKVSIVFNDQEVWAVPYDMPVVGYGGGCVNTLRLWQAEPIESIDLDAFNRQEYSLAYKQQNDAVAISSVLYPNDDTKEGKRLRLKQQYFFSSASLQSLLREYKENHGENLSGFANSYAIQLNDTHPTVAIPELLRLLIAEENMNFEDAFAIVQATFAYTNHTIMAEALEKWDVSLFCSVIPEVYPYVVMLQNHLKQVLRDKGLDKKQQQAFLIVENGQIHMARMAVYATHNTNGVAAIHTQIVKDRVFKEWYDIWPTRFVNKTNGITQRRWLGLCNPELSSFIQDRIGSGWVTNLDELKNLMPYTTDVSALHRFMEIKGKKKQQLANHIYQHENGFVLRPDFLFDIQIKRMHEYKRQLLNAFSIVDIYFHLKEGRLQNFAPTAFLFGGKAAPGYFRAKGIIKYINEIAKQVNNDPDTKHLLQVLFVQNYNVSYAEKLIPAADVSEQISTAGTEASGTGNMKFMLNGAVTLGTYDGANIEIVEESGEENNFIFGARVEELPTIERTYCPKEIYKSNERIRRVLDTLVDGTFHDGNTGSFKELYTSILEGASWHKPDQYYLLLDFESYVEAKLAANKAYQNKEEFAQLCLRNTANAGKFSSDRTIRQYAQEIWNV